MTQIAKVSADWSATKVELKTSLTVPPKTGITIQVELLDRFPVHVLMIEEMSTLNNHGILVGKSLLEAESGIALVSPTNYTNIPANVNKNFEPGIFGKLDQTEFAEFSEVEENAISAATDLGTPAVENPDLDKLIAETKFNRELTDVGNEALVDVFKELS